MNLSETKVSRQAHANWEGDTHAASSNLLTGLHDGPFDLDEVNIDDCETSCG